MARIAAIAEANFPYEHALQHIRSDKAYTSEAAISQATVEIANELGAAAIVTSTYSGQTAKWVASYRPQTPVVAITPRPEVQRQLALVWGVTPMLAPYYTSTDDMVEFGAKLALESGLAKPGDTIVITAGIPIPSGAESRTNMLKVHHLSR
jgi:pyruvate kinase